MSFKSEVSHSWQYPRHAVLKIVKIEDAKRVDDLITSTLTPGDQNPDFENLDIKIASGLKKIPTKNFRNKSPQQNEKLNPRSDNFRADDLLG